MRSEGVCVRDCVGGSVGQGKELDFALSGVKSHCRI